VNVAQGLEKVEGPRTSRKLNEQVSNVAAKFVLGRSRVQISARRLAILTKVFHDFPQSLQANAGTVPQIRIRLLPSISFQINYSLIILSLDAI
jgi:hypothetical protein